MVKSFNLTVKIYLSYGNPLERSEAESEENDYTLHLL